jgi:Mg2+ and Co2+ transporter CorA
MDVYTISGTGIERHSAGELEHLLEQRDRLIWVDMSLCTEQDAAVLSGAFGFHDLAVRDCVERNHVSKIHFYPDHVFTVVHAPELGTGGHVHYVELDQFIGPNYLVTVHGPLNPIVKPEVALRDTASVLRHIEDDGLRPQSPMALSGAILSALVRRETDLVASLAKESGRLEQQVTDDDHGDDPEALLEDLFEVWQELLAIRTMAAHASATYSRMAKLIRSLPESEKPLVTDIADRFDLIRSIAEDQRDFVHGVIEFFQTRTSTHMTIATEQLAADSVRQNDDMRKITAWVAIIAIPTAVTGFFGQNVPYPGFAQKSGFITSTVIIVAVAAALYVTFKLKKWL